MRPRTLTARGFARLLERGIRANFIPERQNAELLRLTELISDLAMSRENEAEILPGANQRQAHEEAVWLGAVAAELEARLPLKETKL